jgi:hypothetical protein
LAFVVFAGQSNTGGAFMTGSTLTQPWTTDPLTRIWNPNSGAWDLLQPGVNTGYGGQEQAWAGEVEFAREFRARFPSEPLNILKVAEGGTGLAVDPVQWHYDWSPTSRDELFDRVADRIAAAGAALGGARPTAVFFGQGEEDASHAETGPNYGAALRQFVAAVRETWMHDPNGKVGFFEIGTNWPYADQVRAGEVAVDQADPNADSFDTAGLPMQNDSQHYAAAGFDAVGAGFFRLYANWTGGGQPPPSGGGQINGTDGPDSLVGGPGADSIGGGGGQDVLRGGEGNDRMSGGDAFDDLNGNQGDDTLAGDAGGDWVVGGKDQDLLFGDDGEDIVYGNLGADTCDGGAGADIVRGGQGDDMVSGGAGADWIAGDRGDDTLTGGSGADTFHSFNEAGLDVVRDFSQSEGDRVLLLSGTTYTVSQVGADTVLQLGGGARMVLQGVQMSSLTDGWITVG